MTWAFFVRTGTPKTPHDGTVQTLLENQVSLTQRTHNSLRNTIQKTKDCVTRTTLINSGHLEEKQLLPHDSPNVMVLLLGDKLALTITCSLHDDFLNYCSCDIKLLSL
jgi:hypothetical protein